MSGGRAGTEGDRTMPTTEDLFRYDVLAQEALRGVMRQVLERVAAEGLPGDHHFYLTFVTAAPGVALSKRMREKYPESITIVIQHRYDGLVADADGFSVGLSFDGVSERVTVPWTAVSGFADPSVRFEMAFQVAPVEAAPKPEEARAPLPEGGAAVVSLDAFRKRR